MADDAPAMLPEVARSLRGLGREGDAAAQAAHAAVFGPLLSARANAARGDQRAALAALHGARIFAVIEAAATRTVAALDAHAARVRAREAAAREALEPLRDELSRLDGLAPDAALPGAASAGWDRWTVQLGRVFVAADVACEGVAAIIRTPGAAGAPGATASRGWPGLRRARGR